MTKISGLLLLAMIVAGCGHESTKTTPTNSSTNPSSKTEKTIIQVENTDSSHVKSPSKSSKLSSVPQEAKDAAIKKEQDSCKNLGWECKDFKIIWAGPLEVTRADDANGTDEKWCMRVEYIYLNGNNKDWRDARSCLQFLKKNGTWQTNDYLCECQ